MNHYLSTLGAFLAASALLLAAANVDWPTYGGSPEGTRYSPLKQINR